MIGRLVARYEYDPVNRRIVIKEYESATGGAETEVGETEEGGPSGENTEETNSKSLLVRIRHLYHTTNWQEIEERVELPNPNPKQPFLPEQLAQQFVWNVGYIDDLAMRDRDTSLIVGSIGDGILDERLYALTDLRYSVMALANASGTIVERFRYEAHGRSTALDSSFAPRTLNPTTGDGSQYAWENRYTGRELDLQTGLYHFRNRYYHADLGRFISRDPIGYVDGMSLYRGYFMPDGLDPSGSVIFSQCNISSFLKSKMTFGYLVTPSKDGFRYHTPDGYTTSGTADQYIDEILVSMMAEKMEFRIKGTKYDEIVKNIELHIETRLDVLRNAQSKVVRFGAGSNAKMPWIPPGLTSQEIWELVNDPKYAIACLYATQLVFNGATGGKSARRVHSHFIPGDWGYIFNDEHSHHDQETPNWPPGLESENVIYMTGGLYWGHIADFQTILTEAQWFQMIRTWGDNPTNPTEFGKPRWRDSVDYPIAGLE